MLEIIRTIAGNIDFINLVSELDAYLAITDGEDHEFYDQYNKLDNIKYVLVAYKDERPVGCGAIKLYEPAVFEVKRMFVKEEVRGMGVATRLLSELEMWAREMNASKCKLETGIRQTSAIKLYKKCGYVRIPNYEQYVGVEESLCFEKQL